MPDSLKVPPASTVGRASFAFISLLAIGMIFAQFARMPQVIVGGRVWAEEGLFLSAAMSRGVVDAMLWRAPVGYYNLQLNVGGLLASRLPLVLAPVVMTTLASWLLVTPLLVVALDPRWRDRHTLGLVAICLLLISPSEEIWLNLSCAQFVLSVATALMLVTTADGRRAGILRSIALALFGLCGVASAMLAPLFVLRAVLTHSRPRVVEAVVLSACLAFQLALVTGAAPASKRYHLDSIKTLGDIVVSRQILQSTVYPLDHFIPFSRHVLSRDVDQAPTVACALALYAALIWVIKRTGQTHLMWLLAAIGLMLAGTVAAAFDPTPTLVHPDVGVRYFYAPNVLLVLTIGFSAQRIRSRISTGIVIVCLAISALDFIFINPYFTTPADWYEQVRTHESDPTHVIHHAPAGWTLNLDVKR